MKPIIVQIFFLFLLFSCSSTRNGELIPIAKAAEARAKEFMNKIPDGEEKDYGFDNRDEFADAVLGEPIEVITLPGEVAHGVSEGSFVRTGEYRVPLEINGEMRSLLTVSENSGGYRCVDFGAAELAAEINKIREATGVNTLKILRLYSVQIDYIAVGNVADENNLRFYSVPFAGGEGLGLGAVRNEYERKKQERN